MKIGEFAQSCQVSRDTVRYYIKIGLLTPVGNSAQYSFSQQDLRDMQTIQKMKDQHFSLEEIRAYLKIQRVSTMVEPESIQDAAEILSRKRLELMEQIKQLRQICGDLDQEVQGLLYQEVEGGKPTGVPLSALRLLCCPRCGNPLQLEYAQLDAKYVYSGQLTCGCGYRAEIDQGIVQTGNLYTGPYDSPDLKRGLYRTESKNFISHMRQCEDATLKALQSMDLKGKVILEGHINGYFFLYRYFEQLERDCTYVIVDKYPEMLLLYKHYIEQLNLELDILYLADNSMNWPLLPHCVDMMVDFLDDGEHSLYSKQFYIQEVGLFLKKKAQIVGASLGYDEGAKSLKQLALKYPEGGWQAFHWAQVPQLYAQAGYRYLRQEIGILTQTSDGYAFACHIDGENLRIGYFHAVPLKT